MELNTCFLNFDTNMGNQVLKSLTTPALQTLELKLDVGRFEPPALKYSQSKACLGTFINSRLLTIKLWKGRYKIQNGFYSDT